MNQTPDLLIEKEFSGQKSIEFISKKLGYDSPVTRSFYTKQNVYQEYTNKVPIGLDTAGKMVYVDFSNSKRVLILGMPGSGKTFLARSLISRYYKGVGDVCVLTDIKNEYYTCSEPIQSKFVPFLLKNEQPEGLKTKVYYPYFLAKNSKKRYDNIICQLDLTQLTASDMITLVGMSNLTDIQRISLIAVFEEILKGKIKDIDSLKSYVELNDNLSKSTKRAILSMSDVLVSTGVIGDQFSEFDFTRDLLDKNITVLNLEGFDKIGQYIDYASAFVAYIMRRIYSDKKNYTHYPKSKKLLFMIDELNCFCPNVGNPASKIEIEEVLARGRYYGVSMIFATQKKEKVPDSIFKDCDYILLPHTIDTETAKDVIKRKVPSYYDYPVLFAVTITNILSKMKKHKDGSRDWLLIDTHDRDEPLKIITPLPALCKHAEE